MLTEAALIRKYSVLLTVEQVAEALHYSPETVARKIREGTFEVPMQKRGKDYVCPAATLARYIDAIDAALDAS